MGQAILFPFTQSKKIYRGNPDCPRTVVIQQMNEPGINDNFTEAIFLSTDDAALDAASITGVDGKHLSVLSEGVAIGRINSPTAAGFSHQIVLRHVTQDIFARALYFDVTTQTNELDKPFFVNTESF